MTFLHTNFFSRYTDTKGAKYTKHIVPKRRSYLSDLRMCSTDKVPRRKEKKRWACHNQHWRGVQRRQVVPPRNGAQNPQQEFNA